MRIDFRKMHGLGNDFIVLDDRDGRLPHLDEGTIRRLSDRRSGIGCDQFILLEAHETADALMRIFNADGSEVEACGNAARAIGLLLGERATLATKGGTITTTPAGDDIAVDMGVPRFGWEAIPLAYAMDTLEMPVGWHELERPSAVNVGNPHVVFFVDADTRVGLGSLGPEIEEDPLFPEKINVNVARVRDRRTIDLAVWERGAGLTRACGTGACATAVCAMRRGLTERVVTVRLPGGPLQIAWGEDDRITMTGPATEAFRGTFGLSDYA